MSIRLLCVDPNELNVSASFRVEYPCTLLSMECRPCINIEINHMYLFVCFIVSFLYAKYLNVLYYDAKLLDIDRRSSRIALELWMQR